jgi:putative membrane protein
MIIKRNFSPFKVVQYVKQEMLFSSFVVIMVYFLHEFELLKVYLPFSITAILGSALAIFIAFRNNSSYSRWWEARTLWGGIINSSRVLARLVITFVDSHAYQNNFDQEKGEKFKWEMVRMIIAWAHALRMQLRGEGDWEKLKPYFSDDQYTILLKRNQKPNAIHLLFGNSLYKAMADGTLGGFDSFQIEGQLLALANYQGGCERIKNTPLLRQYHYFTKLFLYVFILILPFSLLSDFEKWNMTYLIIPVSLLITFVFAIIGKVGEVNEDPFENRITDVPLTSMCNTIERDLFEMLGHTDLPDKIQNEKGFLF